jgi:hypothetical protein
MEIEEPDLVRYWFEFELTSHEPAREPTHVSLDGGTAAYRLLGRGAGVTGFDEADCLRLLTDALGADLPHVARSIRNPTIGDRLAREIGNVAWRGIWFPRLNMGGPVIA